MQYILLFIVLIIQSMAQNNCVQAINSIKQKEISERKYLMGIAYKHGLCVQKNLIKSFEYFFESNLNNYPLSKYELAEMYYYGEGTKKDYFKAYAIYMEILSNMHRDSIINTKIAYMNLKGYGVDKNLTKAREFYTKAANFGHLGANYDLALIYSSGLGVDKNLTEAIKYLGKVVDNRDISNYIRPKAMYILAQILNIENQKKYSKKILNLLIKSAIEGHKEAQVTLGKGYILGKDIDQDMKKAKIFIQRAKEQNSTEAEKLWNKYELWKF